MTLVESGALRVLCKVIEPIKLVFLMGDVSLLIKKVRVKLVINSG